MVWPWHSTTTLSATLMSLPPTSSTILPTFILGMISWICLLQTFNKLLQLLKISSWNVRSCHVLEISVLLVSSSFAILTCIVSSKVMSGYHSSVIYDSIPLIRHWMIVGVSYFVYDVFAMYKVFLAKSVDEDEVPATGSNRFGWLSFVWARPLILIHHILVPFIVVPLVLMQGEKRGDYLIAAFCLMEASTPFVSARRILEILGQKSSVVYAVNGVLMTSVFFLCRVANVWYMYNVYAKELGLPLYQTMVQKVPGHCNTWILLISVLQLYWWSLMVRGCLKFLTKKSKRG